MPSQPGSGVGRPRKALFSRQHDGSFDRLPKADRERILAAQEANPRTGDLVKGCPAPPAYLSPDAHQDWHELVPQVVKLGILELQDMAALALLCEMSREVRELRADIAAGGRTFIVTNNEGNQIERPRPQVPMLTRATAQLSVMLHAFGLTPGGRARLSVAPPKMPDSGDEFFS